MIAQGTYLWHKKRLGKITGSNVFKLMPGKDLGAGAITYCTELACDTVYGEPEEDNYSSPAMERGLELEPIAVEAFCDYMEKKNPVNPVTVDEAGFIIHPNYPQFGASVDGHASDGGNLEIKCRKRKGHLAQLKVISKVKKKEKLLAAELKLIAHYQRQWGMFCTGATHSYFVGYTDELEIDKGGRIIHRFERDEVVIEAMKEKALLASLLITKKVKEYRELIGKLS